VGVRLFGRSGTGVPRGTWLGRCRVGSWSQGLWMSLSARPLRLISLAAGWCWRRRSRSPSPCPLPNGCSTWNVARALRRRFRVAGALGEPLCETVDLGHLGCRVVQTLPESESNLFGGRPAGVKALVLPARFAASPAVLFLRAIPRARSLAFEFHRRLLHVGVGRQSASRAWWTGSRAYFDLRAGTAYLFRTWTKLGWGCKGL